MKYSSLTHIAIFSIVAIFSSVSGMEQQLPFTYTKNKRRVIDVETRAENNFQTNNDFLANISNSSSPTDSLQSKKITKKELKSFQQQNISNKNKKDSKK